MCKSAALSVLVFCLLCVQAVAADDTAAATKPAENRKEIEFFEKKIRPVLVKHCYECHSAKAKKVQGGLLLDTRAGIRRGGESGPAIVPGKVDESLLIDAIRYASFEMPPKKKLPKQVIADFVTWVKNGAADPRDGKPRGTRPAGLTIDFDEARKFWAFQRPQRTPPPKVRNRTWPRSDIDRFLLHRLEKEGLTPVADADRRTLIRRVTFDLTGLPPKPGEIAAFLQDDSKNAFEKVVDRLLASPQFGEHWGRHWLDVARYADSNGGDINLTFHNAWRYRDYVINAFNTDKPFDRFIVEQLAGDLMPHNTDQQRSEQLIATGFLIIGPKMLSERDKEKLRMDVVDEQLDTVGRAFLGMTLGCARCHDHKFDPIPTRDYYAMAGFFRSTTTVQGIRMGNVNVSGWIERPLPMKPDHKRALAEHKRKLAQLNKQIAALKKQLGPSKGGTVVAAKQLPGILVDDVDAKRQGNWKKSTYVAQYVGKGYVHDDKTGKGDKSITFTPMIPKAGRYEIRISYAGGGGRDSKVPVTVRHAGGEKTIFVNQSRQPRIGGLFHAIGQFRFEAGRSGAVTISNKGTTDYVIADAVQFLPVGELAKPFKKSAPKKSAEERKRELKLKSRLKVLEGQLAALKKAAPRPAPMTMAAADREQPADCRIRIRGGPHKLGRVAPRGFLTVATTDSAPDVNTDQSGRLELARWIASKNNPLTSRVIVNRIWHHLFGVGIVPSVDNFGRLGGRPSHPQLLDRLAVDFVEDGWSVKRAIRRIVLSRAYQLSSAKAHGSQPVGLAADPKNRLLWRHNRRRLAAEAIRDAMLAASGQLNLKAGESSVTGLGEQAVANNLRDKTGRLKGQATRRSIYLPLIRNDLPDFLTVFDFADPNVVVGARSVTTVPAQALLMMNSNFVKEQARLLAERVLRQEDLDETGRLAMIYELTLGRKPTGVEQSRALSYIREQDAKNATAAWADFCHAILASTEFRFVE